MAPARGALGRGLRLVLLRLVVLRLVVLRLVVLRLVVLRRRCCGLALRLVLRLAAALRLVVLRPVVLRLAVPRMTIRGMTTQRVTTPAVRMARTTAEAADASDRCARLHVSPRRRLAHSGAPLLALARPPAG